MSDNNFPMGRPVNRDTGTKSQDMNEYQKAQDDEKNWKPHPTNPDIFVHSITGRMRTKNMTSLDTTPVQQTVQNPSTSNDDEEQDYSGICFLHDEYCFTHGWKLIEDEI